MSGYRGYNNYRGRTSKGKTVLTVVLILIILASIGFMLLQKYVVYDAAGTPHLMLPGRETAESVLPEEGEEKLNLTISPSEQKAFVSRSFSVTEALTMESWRQAWTEAPKGCNAVTADMKVSGSGKLFFDGGYFRKDGQDILHHRPGTVGNGVLFQIADLCLPAFGQIAAVVLQFSRDDFEQGGFARAVDTDKTDFIFIVYVEGHVFKQSFAGKRFIDIRSVQQQHF